MLNINKVMYSIDHVASDLFPDRSHTWSILMQGWHKLVSSNTIGALVEQLPFSSLTPQWLGDIEATTLISNITTNYTILGIDGSQIYPDRHVSCSECFLINIGGCLISYSTKSTISLFSDPFLLLQEQIFNDNMAVQCSPDFVDLIRQAYELEQAFKIVQKCKGEKPVLLFDGGIIFWYLASKQKTIKDMFLKRYLTTLDRLYENQVLTAGYISFSKSKELINLIKVALCLSNDLDQLPCLSTINKCPCSQVNGFLDRDLLQHIVPFQHRTTLFSHRSPIVEEYPEHLKPYFCYINVGEEIIRLEIPAWVAKDNAALESLSQTCLNQAHKGSGYPVVLAEAHEQAVIKAADREFFFHLIRKAALKHGKHISFSQKNFKKRNMGV